MLRNTLSLLGLLVLGSSVLADSITYSYTLTGADPTYNRTLVGNPPTSLSGVGTNNHYHVQPFYVNVTNTYTLQTTAANLTPVPADDTFITLYQTLFTPGSPLVNALQADDDSSPAGALSLISRPLTAGTQYFLVTTTFGANVTGDFSVQIDTTTQGNFATLGLIAAVPEPSTIALIGIAGVGALASGRRYFLRRKARFVRSR